MSDLSSVAWLAISSLVYWGFFAHAVVRSRRSVSAKAVITVLSALFWATFLLAPFFYLFPVILFIVSGFKKRPSSNTVELEQRPVPAAALAAMFMAVAISALFCKTPVRAIPGGPFISISANVLPTLASVVGIAIGMMCLKSKPPLLIQSLIICGILIATFVAGASIVDMYTAWTDPRLRGSLWGL